MLNAFRGSRPDITPIQATATLVAGVPVIGNLLSAFGVYTISPAQQAALTDSITWGGVLAGLLILGDTGLRAARNSADAKRDAAVIAAPAAPPPAVAGIDPEHEALMMLGEELPGDDEEFAAPPPGEDPLTDEDPEAMEARRPVQPSEAEGLPMPGGPL
jgi:hypothetical protein